MKIYTKMGDSGETGLYGGSRVSKDNLRIQAYGTLDELNTVLGLALSDDRGATGLRGKLNRIQSELFQLGAELATPADKVVKGAKISQKEITAMEVEIDEMESHLAPLKAFILPGGSRLASLLHLARAVSRRAEREMVTLNATEKLRSEVLQYVNRLSDYLFVCARFANHQEKIADVPWISS